MAQIKAEFPGEWFFSNGTNFKAGVAIGILKPFGIDVVKDSFFNEGTGRLIGVGLKANNKLIYVISAYGPCVRTTKTSRIENFAFLQRLQALKIEKRAEGYEVISGGDLNFIRTADLDAEGGSPTVHPEQADWMDNLENNCDFHDVQRFTMPATYLETYYHGAVTGVKRRLDYFLASHDTLERVISVEAIPSANSDHRLMKIVISLGSEKIQGPGLWKHNNALLKDDDYEVAIIQTIAEAKSSCHTDDPRFLWEWTKHKVRDRAIQFSKTRSKERRAERLQLEQDYVQKLRESADITEVRNSLHNHFRAEDDIIRFRARLDVAEKDERISPFFFRKILTNRSESNVTSIKTDAFPAGTKTREQTMEALETHYRSTFQDRGPKACLGDEWWNEVSKISETTKAKTEAKITKNDVTRMIHKEMDTGKSPGDDGLTVDFYRKFWQYLVDPLFNSLKASQEKGQLSDSQRRSVIRLIAKKGKDQTEIKGWRPISLMNTDAKIFSKCLAERLKMVCSEVIGEEQLAYLEGRTLQDGHLVMNKVLDLTRKKKISGLVACIDFRGAFDSIRHRAIWDTLERMNVGPELISMLKTLYKDASSSVLNFGTKTSFFDLELSCRQGDPVASYIFILVLEVLLTRIRRVVKGIKIDSATLIALAYADDLTIFTKDNDELLKALRIIENFEEASGLAINRQKSEILELGVKANASGIPVSEMVKITGIHFCLDEATMINKNWTDVLDKVTKMTRNWQQRSLTEIGKTNIVNAQLMPHVTFVGSSMVLPEMYEKKLNKIIFQFLWGKSEKECRSLCVKSRKEGGLAMPHIRSRLKAIQCCWIHKLRNKGGVFAMAFANTHLIATEDSSFRSPLHSTDTDFPTTCVNAWSEVLQLLDVDRGGLLWPHLHGDIQKLVKHKIPGTTITDAEIGTWSDLNFLENASVRSATKELLASMEDKWCTQKMKTRNLLSEGMTSDRWRTDASDRQATAESLLRQRYSGLTICRLNTQRKIYWLLVDQIMPPLHKFREMIEHTYAQEWTMIDGCKLFTQSRLESFQWRGQHGKLYARKDLLRFGYTTDSRCNYCDVDVQTVSHLFLECPRVSLLFKNFEKQYKLVQEISDCERMIGIDTRIPRDKLTLKKLGILRKTVYDCNHDCRTPKWEEVLVAIDRLYITEYGIAERNGRIDKVLTDWGL